MSNDNMCDMRTDILDLFDEKKVQLSVDDNLKTPDLSLPLFTGTLYTGDDPNEYCFVHEASFQGYKKTLKVYFRTEQVDSLSLMDTGEFRICVKFYR